jgi:hypothetical protein
MIEDLIDFMEIHPIVTLEAIYEPMVTSFWSLISFAVHNNANTKGRTQVLAGYTTRKMAF